MYNCANLILYKLLFDISLRFETVCILKSCAITYLVLSILWCGFKYVYSDFDKLPIKECKKILERHSNSITCSSVIWVYHDTNDLFAC